MLAVQLDHLLHKFYAPPVLANDKLMQAWLKDQKIHVVDVGSTAGVDKRWSSVQKLCHFYTFDPDPRAKVPNLKINSTNFPIGLHSSEKKSPFYLAAFPDSSSIYPFNQQGLSAFLNHAAHDVVDTSEIQLSTLEKTLSQEPNPDFIKVDAEGTDLEILKGGKRYLLSSCLGIQVEVSFFNRFEGAPLFHETDEYLKQFDFELFDICREKWIRKNNLFGSHSRSQLIYANAIYFLSIPAFLKNLENLQPDGRRVLFAKFITLLLTYRMHDYAEEVRQRAYAEKLIDSNTAEKTFKLLKKSVSSKPLYLFKLLFITTLSMFGILLAFPFRKVRKLGISFFKQRVRELATVMINCTRTGPQDAVIADHEL